MAESRLKALDDGSFEYSPKKGTTFTLTAEALVRRLVALLVALSAAAGEKWWSLAAPEGHESWARWSPALHGSAVHAQTLAGVARLVG